MPGIEIKFGCCIMSDPELNYFSRLGRGRDQIYIFFLHNGPKYQTVIDAILHSMIYEHKVNLNI